MFIGHLPCGYLFSRALAHTDRWRDVPPAVPLAASVAPDLDLLYFYLVDDRQHLHHSYWTHLPAWWLVIGLAGVLLSRSPRLRAAGLCVEAFALTVVVAHLVPDTTVGGIRWLYPLDLTWFRVATVEAGHGPWMLNFVFHWSFLLEVAVCALAVGLAARRFVRAGVQAQRAT